MKDRSSPRCEPAKETPRDSAAVRHARFTPCWPMTGSADGRAGLERRPSLGRGDRRRAAGRRDHAGGRHLRDRTEPELRRRGHRRRPDHGPRRRRSEPAVIEFDAVEGFKVSAPHWVVREPRDRRRLRRSTPTASTPSTSSAMPTSPASASCRLRDFNAQIKSNQLAGVFPDDVVVERCELGDTAARNTAQPVTKIDVVGGRRWRLRANSHPRRREGGRRPHLLLRLSQGQLARRHLRAQSDRSASATPRAAFVSASPSAAAAPVLRRSARTAPARPSTRAA